MLVCVAFEYVERCGCEDCVEEEGSIPLSPSSSSVAIVCVVVLACAIVSSSLMSLAEAVWTSSYDCSKMTTSVRMLGVRLRVFQMLLIST